jgi:hypothetical protein
MAENNSLLNKKYAVSFFLAESEAKLPTEAAGGTLVPEAVRGYERTSGVSQEATGSSVHLT